MYFMDSIIKRFVFTVGPPGSGKSTQFPDAYEADKYPNLYSRSGHINKRLLKLAHTKCLEDCIKDMTQGTQLVVQSNTNLNSKNLISYLEACVRYNYQVNCILPSWDCDGNICNDPGNGLRQYSTLIACEATCTNVGVQIIGLNNLKIYPNPSEGVFNIEFNSAVKNNLEIKIYNILGENIFLEYLTDFTGEYIHKIDLLNQAKGI